MNSMDINTHTRTPDKRATFAGYAFFPGTGPSLMSCADCALSAKIGAHSYCRKWQELRKSSKPGPAIDKCSESCKYFQRREN